MFASSASAFETTVVFPEICSVSSGDLYVQGNRVTEVNGEIHEMKISGIVRENDIHGDNQVYSYRIANASISYQKMGGLRDKKRASKLINKVIVTGITGGLAAVAVLNAVKN